MGAALKVLAGLILIIIGLWLFADGPLVDWLQNFIIVLTGVIPILLILVGIFVVWLEIDEMKTQKELSNDAKSLRPAKATKKKKR